MSTEPKIDGCVFAAYAVPKKLIVFGLGGCTPRAPLPTIGLIPG